MGSKRSNISTAADVHLFEEGQFEAVRGGAVEQYIYSEKFCHRSFPMGEANFWKCMGKNCALWSTEWEDCGDLIDAESKASLAKSVLDLSEREETKIQILGAFASLFERFLSRFKK